MKRLTVFRCVGLAAICALLASGAVARPKPKVNTLLLGDLGDGSQLWLMLDSIRSDEGAIRHGWSVIDFPGPETTENIQYRSDASKFYVDCKTMQINLANAIKFSGPMGGGKNVFQVNSEPTPEPAAKDYHPVRVGTAEEVVAKAICKPKLR
jgi:hypothetical protein